MTVEEVINLVIDAFDHCGIPYMVAGSFASNVHGIPRSTYDADIVVDLEAKNFDCLREELGEDFYLSTEAAREAMANRSMFNIIHIKTGFKLDLITQKTRPFSREEFSRKMQVRFAGEDRWFASPEDVILTKLEWSKLGQSERQFRDALSVAQIQGKSLDLSYLQHWATQLDVADLLSRLLDEKNQ